MLKIPGKVKATFGVRSNAGVEDMLIQKDGKIVLTGTDNVTPKPNLALARFFSNGIIDSTFGTNGRSVIPTIYKDEAYIKSDIQSDGKLVACGWHQDSVSSSFIAVRINNTVGRIGVKNTEKNTPLSIYPNPTTNVLNIDFKEPITTDIKLTITDITGRVVYQQGYDKAMINKNLQINIQDLTMGLYVVNILLDKENISRVISKL